MWHVAVVTLHMKEKNTGLVTSMCVLAVPTSFTHYHQIQESRFGFCYALHSGVGVGSMGAEQWGFPLTIPGNATSSLREGPQVFGPLAHWHHS